MVGDHFPLTCLPLAEEVSLDRAAYQVVLSHISQSDLKVEHTVSDGYQRVSAEHYRGSSTCRLRELGKEDARHHGRDDDAGDALDAHRDDGKRTSTSGSSPSIPCNSN